MKLHRADDGLMYIHKQLNYSHSENSKVFQGFQPEGFDPTGHHMQTREKSKKKKTQTPSKSSANKSQTKEDAINRS